MISAVKIGLQGWEIEIGNPILRCWDKNNEINGLLHKEIKVKFKVEECLNNNEFKVFYRAEEWIMSDRITEAGEGFFEVERCWVNLSDMPKDVILLFEAFTMYEPEYYMIPCVNYNGNRYGTGNEPKGLAYNNQPWVFAYNRSGLPSATFSENSLYSVGLFADSKDEKSLVSACSMEKTGQCMTHRLYWPDIERPVTYKGRDRFGPSVEKTVRIASNEEYRVKFYLSVSTVEERNTGWMKTYDRFSEADKRNCRPVFSPEQVWKMEIKYVKTNLFNKIDENSLFEIGLLPGGGHDIKAGPGMEWKHRNETRYEIGWCGQNASLACALIYDYLREKDGESLDMAINVLDTWESKARIKNGLFYVMFDDVISGMENVDIDVCNLGWGAWQFMNAYMLARKAGVDKPSWLNMGLELCDFFLKEYNNETMFGKLWRADGTCADATGTAGAFILLPMLKAYEIKREVKYLSCAINAFKAYKVRDLDMLECTAGALDTCCIDKETCWPLLKAALDLYEITKEDFYLKSALKAGYYLLSWMFHYDVLSDGDCDFLKYNYHTYGATAVSTQHHHLDPWGGLICCEWLRLYRHTGDVNWKSRALATWCNSLLCMSDGNLQVHGMVRPEGSQNEAFFHCDWAFSDQHEISRGSMNDWLVAWPCAFKLVMLMGEKQWDLLA